MLLGGFRKRYVTELNHHTNHSRFAAMRAFFCAIVNPQPLLLCYAKAKNYGRKYPQIAR